MLSCSWCASAPFPSRLHISLPPFQLLRMRVGLSGLILPRARPGCIYRGGLSRCRSPPAQGTHSPYPATKTRTHVQLLIIMYGPFVSYTARSSSRTYVARCPASGAARRVPFSFVAFPSAARDSSNLAMWIIDELQICEMGTWAPDGAYVWVAGCDLRLGHS